MDRWRLLVVALPLLAYFLFTAVASEPLQQEKSELFLGQSSDLTVARTESSEDLEFQAVGTGSASLSGDFDGELGFTEGGEGEEGQEDDEDEDGEGEGDDSATDEEENGGRRRMLQAPLSAMPASAYVKLLESGKQLPVLSGGGSLRTKRVKGRKGKGKGHRRSPQARLRSAINEANAQGGRPFTFFLNGDVFLSSELPLLVGSLTVVGACKNPREPRKTRPCIIDGQRRFPIFKASASQTFCQLNLSNLILQNAVGGAYTGDAKQQFAATCDLIADQVTFRNNKNAAGGAIFMLGVYTLSRCLFEGNSADGDGGAIVAGDQAGFYLAPALGSYLAGKGSITRTTFLNNVAGLKPNWLNPGSGGAVAHFGGPTLTIFRTIFAKNKAGVRPLVGAGPRSPTAGVSGGALHFRAGDNVTIIRSAFEGNVAPEGGAVYAAPLLQYDQWAEPVGPNTWGRATFCRTTFEKNSARRFPDVSINTTYAFDRGMIEARFCPAAPRGVGTARPSKVRIVSKKCNRCRFG